MKRRNTIGILIAAVMLGGILCGCQEPVDPLDVVYKNDQEEISVRKLFEGSQEVLGNANYLHVTGSCHSEGPAGQKEDNDFDFEAYYTDDDNYLDVLSGDYESSSITSIFNEGLGCDSGYTYSRGKTNGVEINDFHEHSHNSSGFTLKQQMVDVNVKKILFPDLSNVMIQFSGRPESGHYYVTLRGDLSYFNGSFGRKMAGGGSNINEVRYSFSADTHVLEKVYVTGEKKEIKEYIKDKKTELIYRFRGEFNVKEASYDKDKASAPDSVG